MERKGIPTYDLADYSGAMHGIQGIYARRFEVVTRWLPNRLRLHRHDAFEVFWLEGDGTHFNDFRVYPISTPKLIFVSPGQVHRWSHEERVRGITLSFTQEFFDGDAPPPSALLRHHFWYPRDCSPVLDLPGSAAAETATICQEIVREFDGQGSRRGDMPRALLRVLFIRADRLYAEQQQEMV